MNYRLIACNIFQREACACVARSPHVVDVDFLELGEHARPDNLRTLLQARIDAAAECTRNYDAILLLFGLCGNSAVGVQARSTQLIIPRAHDCCTILLGSRQRFVEHFGAAPSTPFSSSGYLERGEYFLRTNEDGAATVSMGDGYKQLVEQYGEEDAKFIWDEMHPKHDQNLKAVFIDLPQTAHLNHAARFQEKVAEAGKEYVHLDGDIRLIRDLINGQWNDREYLIVPPGRTIEGVYDHDQVIRAK